MSPMEEGLRTSKNRDGMKECQNRHRSPSLCAGLQRENSVVPVMIRFSAMKVLQ